MTDTDPDLAAYQSLAANGPIPRDGGGRYTTASTTVGHQSPPTETEAMAEAMTPPKPLDPPKPLEKPAAGAVTAADLESFQGLAKRFKVPQRLQESAKDMPREELLAWTEDLRKMQTAFDEKKGATADSKGAPAEGQPSQEAGTPNAEAKGAPKGGEKGSDIRSRVIAAFAANGIDDEATNAVLELLETRGSDQPQSQPALAEMVETVRAMQEKQARDEVGKQFPGLADDKRYENVRARVAKWIANGDYEPSDVATAMRDAARIEFFDDRKSSKPSRGEPPTDPTAREGIVDKDPDRDVYDRLARGQRGEEIERARGR